MQNKMNRNLKYLGDIRHLGIIKEFESMNVKCHEGFVNMNSKPKTV